MLVPVYYLPYEVPCSCDGSSFAPTNWFEWLLYIAIIAGLIISVSVMLYELAISPIKEKILCWWYERRRKK